MSLHYNGANSYLFVNGVEQFKFKAKDSTIVANPLCLGNISKDWGVRNMKKQDYLGTCMGMYSVDYDAANFFHIVFIHNYLMMKNNIK